MCPKERSSDDAPGFAKDVPGGASEEEQDEMNILADQDLSEKLDTATDDENLGAHSKALDELEEEPNDFLTGEVDVKEQMDRAADAMEASISGYPDRSSEDSPRSELGSAFRNTPGGLEEVEFKTDQELAKHHHIHRIRHQKEDHRKKP